MRGAAWAAGLAWFVASVTAGPARAAEPGNAWDFIVLDQGREAGERIFFQLVWTNKSEAAIEVPADLLTNLDLDADYRATPRALRIGHGRAAPLASTPVPASSLAWQTVAPGASIVRLGELSEFFKECVGGCVAGEYTLALETASRNVAVTGAKVVPAMPTANWTRKLEADTFGVHADAGLRAEIIAVHGRGKQATATLRVTNGSGVPVWIPKREWLSVQWDGREVQADGSETRFGIANAAGGQSSWDTGGATLVAPGKSITLTTVLDFIDPGSTKLYARAQLTPISRFEPLRAGAVPFYLEDDLFTPEFRLR